MHNVLHYKICCPWTLYGPCTLVNSNRYGDALNRDITIVLGLCIWAIQPKDKVCCEHLSHCITQSFKPQG